MKFAVGELGSIYPLKSLMFGDYSSIFNLSYSITFTFILILPSKISSPQESSGKKGRGEPRPPPI